VVIGVPSSSGNGFQECRPILENFRILCAKIKCFVNRLLGGARAPSAPMATPVLLLLYVLG